MASSLHRGTIVDAGDIAGSVAYFSRFSLSPTAKILDVGTRYGSFLQRLYEQGYQALYGLDVEAGPLYEGGRVYPALGSASAPV
jgi:2-polyprenyl-3-methyl-5-hydroxy-6-metoxy-1,4-benzoquinol methylase